MHTLYAQWKDKSEGCVVDFVIIDETDEKKIPAPVTVEYGGSMDMPYAGKPGYEITVARWHTTKKGAEAEKGTNRDVWVDRHNSGTFDIVTEDTTFFGCWDAKKWEIVFLNGIDQFCDDTPDNGKTMTGIGCDPTAKIPANTFTKEGYTFLGWFPYSFSMKEGMEGFLRGAALKDEDTIGNALNTLLDADTKRAQLVAIWAKADVEGEVKDSSGNKVNGAKIDVSPVDEQLDHTTPKIFAEKAKLLRSTNNKYSDLSETPELCCDIKLKDANGSEVNNLSQEVTVTLESNFTKFEDIQPVVLHEVSSGNVEEVPVDSYNAETGEIKFKTKSFSPYAVYATDMIPVDNEIKNITNISEMKVDTSVLDNSNANVEIKAIEDVTAGGETLTPTQVTQKLENAIGNIEKNSTITPKAVFDLDLGGAEIQGKKLTVTVKVPGLNAKLEDVLVAHMKADGSCDQKKVLKVAGEYVTFETEDASPFMIAVKTAKSSGGRVTGYTVTWDIDEKKTTEPYIENSSPKYKGKTPVKAADANNTYKFKGWDKAFTPVHEDVTYKAVYETSAFR